MGDNGRAGRVPRTDSEIRDAEWSDADLSGSYERVAFVDMDLTELINEGGSFTGCTFTGTRFNVSRHTDAAFVNCAFSNCSFFEAAFTNCKLVGSAFASCTFGLLTIDGGDWSFAGMAGADLRRSRISRVRMREIDLTGAVLREATLHQVDLSGATLDRTDLRDADLRGSDLSALDPGGALMRGAVIDVAQAVTLASALGLVVKEDLPPG